MRRFGKKHIRQLENLSFDGLDPQWLNCVVSLQAMSSLEVVARTMGRSLTEIMEPHKDVLQVRTDFWKLISRQCMGSSTTYAQA